MCGSVFASVGGVRGFVMCLLVVFVGGYSSFFPLFLLSLLLLFFVFYLLYYSIHVVTVTLYQKCAI